MLKTTAPQSQDTYQPCTDSRGRGRASYRGRGRNGRGRNNAPVRGHTNNPPTSTWSPPPWQHSPRPTHWTLGWVPSQSYGSVFPPPTPPPSSTKSSHSSPWPNNNQPTWPVPPCPYPSTPSHRSPSSQTQFAGILGSHQTTTPYTPSEPTYTPTDIEQAMYTMSLNPPDNNCPKINY
ncbi:hypothetical protein E3N88_29990 [Mikania micrantha]|uniref:Uncharacterized protein n=1 Tax=Mikania micrantha TaxID=192012 RepID=A0A5N6MMH1_9ASTR|nr:hypothetical protein E3N88_29990 [Mikania micrantha]